MVDVWTILNVHQINADKRLRDPRRSVLRKNCPITIRNMNTILKIADMVENMNARNGKLRDQTFTIDTSKSIINTLRGVVDMVDQVMIM